MSGYRSPSSTTVLVLLMTLAAIGFSAQRATAFPGVWLTKSKTSVRLPTTHVVMMRDRGVSVITTMVDYQGPLESFALVLPVPKDVELSRIETVKQEFLARLEEFSAPRLTDFWEKDPCLPGAAEQAWEEKLPVKSRGFLTPSVVPPRDSHYPVSNELSLPSKPVFKRLESEFRYHLLAPATLAAAEAWFQRRGYLLPALLQPSLARMLGRDAKLLVAEVVVERAELVGSNHLQLAGIRYWTRQQVDRIEASLGPDRGTQDLFIYTLHPRQRYQAERRRNVFPPTNLVVDPELDANLGVFYNALYDLLVKKQPQAVVTEFVGKTDACGPPCPNAPLKLRELLTLGGDVLERQNSSGAAALPQYAVESNADRERFEATLEGMSEPEQRRARRERETYTRALATRRALLARQTYLLSRLHYRSTAGVAPPDIHLGPATERAQGGFGVPRGPVAAVAKRVNPGDPDAFQVRLFAAHPWRGSMKCNKPVRWRWGKRWKSHSQHFRKVHTARNLAMLARDPKVLAEHLQSALPELGFVPALPPTAEPEPDSGAPAPAPKASGWCSLRWGATPESPASLALPLLLALLWMFQRRRHES